MAISRAPDTKPDPHGHRDPYTVFVNRHWKWLVSFAHGALKAGIEAEDYVQDALYDAWQDETEAKCKGNENCVHYWVLRLLRRRVRDDRRKTRRRGAPIVESLGAAAGRVSAALTPLDRVVSEELHVHVDRAFGQLPERCREVFMMVRVKKMKYAATAAALQINIGTVGPHLRRAQRLLREQLGAVGYKAFKDCLTNAEEVAPWLN